MGIIIREMNENDIEGKAYVHYKSWHETYTGLVSDKYMKNITLEKCVDIAKRYSENTVVAIIDDKVVGFACYGQSRDEDLANKNTGELMAIYIIKAYQGRGIGKLMVNACFQKLSSYKKVSVWVLSENYNTIGFYKSFGFEADGTKRLIKLGEPIKEMRMMKYR